MGSKAPQPPPPEYQVGDIVVASVDILILGRAVFPRELIARKGELLQVHEVDSESRPMRCVMMGYGKYSAFEVEPDEITKPPKPTSPPPPRKP